MSGLNPATQIMVCLLALVATGTLGTFLGAVLWELARPELSAVGRLGRRVLGFLECAFRNIVDGFKNAVEWAFYGPRNPDVSRLFG